MDQFKQVFPLLICKYAYVGLFAILGTLCQSLWASNVFFYILLWGFLLLVSTVK